MTRFIDFLLGKKRVIVQENERLLALYKGEFLGIFGPGEHVLPNRENALVLNRHDLASPQVPSKYIKSLFDKLPAIAETHWTVFQTGTDQTAIIERDGAIYKVLGPNEKLVVWRDGGPWKETVFDLSDGYKIPRGWAYRLIQERHFDQAYLQIVNNDQVGMLFVDGVMSEQLKPGKHAFWMVGQSFELKIVDLKRDSLDVSGQEMLTKDRVTIRVNLSADYRVVDVVKAMTEVQSYKDVIYRSVQQVFRRELGALTLDQILERKEAISQEAGVAIREELSDIGVEISDISLKDIILPGEMREILNQVVAAEKEAQANVIRRREETNATRSLLNTAKVMADNPIMLRLKELEALETVAGKVQTLTVHNGTDGLMNDLVKLRSD